MKKITVRLTGEDGNVFNIMGIVSKSLKRAGMAKEASEYTKRAFSADSYDEVLQLTMEYVDVE